MATTSTATLTFRVDPGVKEALRTAAQQEHRSIANTVEVLIRDYSKRNGIPIDGATGRREKVSINNNRTSKESERGGD